MNNLVLFYIKSFVITIFLHIFAGIINTNLKQNFYVKEISVIHISQPIVLYPYILVYSETNFHLIQP